MHSPNQFIQDDRTIDVIHSDRPDSDYELFFGPIRPEAVPYFTEEKNLGNILADLGLVPSRGWARKNGFNKDLTGFHEVILKKANLKVYILV